MERRERRRSQEGRDVRQQKAKETGESDLREVSRRSPGGPAKVY